MPEKKGENGKASLHRRQRSRIAECVAAPALRGCGARRQSVSRSGLVSRHHDACRPRRARSGSQRRSGGRAWPDPLCGRLRPRSDDGVGRCRRSRGSARTQRQPDLNPRGSFKCRTTHHCPGERSWDGTFLSDKDAKKRPTECNRRRRLQGSLDPRPPGTRKSRVVDERFGPRMFHDILKRRFFPFDDNELPVFLSILIEMFHGNEGRQRLFLPLARSHVHN